MIFKINCQINMKQILKGLTQRLRNYLDTEVVSHGLGLMSVLNLSQSSGPDFILKYPLKQIVGMN